MLINLVEATDRVGIDSDDEGADAYKRDHSPATRMTGPATPPVASRGPNLSAN